MFLVPVNYFSVVIAALVSMLTGFIWYGPLFGKQWMKLAGITEKQMEAARKGMNGKYLTMFVSSAVMAYVLFHFIWFTKPGSYNLTVGLKTAVWAWLGFVATTSLSGYLFGAEKKPWELYVLDNAFRLVSLLFMAAVLVLI
ncbi:DUF1761 domain-containing protein [Patescibacteria group bacterium]|nr:DUF1761 domain-containing protein [Patescibacteria group bacterium]